MRKDTKVLIKFFLAVFLISFLVTNWDSISWVFNYEFMSQATSNLFNSGGKDITGITQTSVTPVPDNPQVFNKNEIEIPGLNIKAPLIFATSIDNEDLLNYLKKGVALYGGSALPGNPGQTIVLGHSAPPNWPKINYDWVFTNINDLNNGDHINVYFNFKKYTYVVTNKTIIDPGGDIPQNTLTNNNNMLVLISCWPPGKNYKRIAVEAELQE